METTPSTDYQTQVIALLTDIDQKLTHIDSFMGLFEETAKTICAYGFAFVPLIILVLMLWWFFKQFLQSY
jgi:hypothetical protein